jgi:hypothetical protein
MRARTLEESLCVDVPGENIVRFYKFEVSTSVTMKNAVFWDVALVRTDVSEERIVSIIRVTRICELGTTLAVN